MTNNILPEVWGPHGWQFIHYVALGYPEQPTEKDKVAYKTFFESLQNVLPCQSCATHYRENLRKLPISTHLKDRESIMRWTIDIHNEVNISKGRPVVSYDTALKLYTQKQFPLVSILTKTSVLVLILFWLYRLLR